MPFRVRFTLEHEHAHEMVQCERGREQQCSIDKAAKKSPSDRINPQSNINMTPNQLITTILALSIFGIISLHAQNVATPPSWTSKDGRVIQAKFVKLDGEAVIIEKEGKEIIIPLAKLSTASVALAKRLGASGNGASPSTKPSADSSPQSAGQLDGAWIMTEGRGVPSVEITSTRAGGAQFSWWADTVPENTKYGPFKMVLLGDSISDKSLKYGYATEDAGFCEHVFFLKLDGEQLVLEMLT